MILITGATGANGAAIVRRLAGLGAPIRAMARSPAGDAAARLRDLPGVELVGGDFDDPASLTRALAGIERAFLLTPSSARAETQQRAFVAAAQATGVRHIVKLSQFAATPDSPVRFLRYHAAVEAAVRASGLDWTFLRPNLFMQGLLAFAPGIRATGRFAAAIGDARVSIVDTRDITAAAVAALTGKGHAGMIYTLTGPEALTHAEMAARIAAAAGRPVEFDDITPAAMRDMLAQVGMDAWQADGLIEDYAHYARGEASAVEDGVLAATGAPARMFTAFARDFASEFQA